MWIQKEINLKPRFRGFHIITRSILKGIPELKDFKIGILQLFIKHTSASITINELSLLVKEVRLIERAINNPINKDTVTKDLEDMRNLFTKGLVAKKNINQNTKLEPHHLEAIKPCLGIPAYEYHSVLGIEINKNLKKGDIIRYKDLKSQS